MCMLWFIGLVITSYSIHYTKLYEPPRSGGSDDGAGRCGGAAALGDEEELVALARLRVQLDLGGQVGAGVLLLRITSYNVCYTKLLRNMPFATRFCP